MNKSLKWQQICLPLWLIFWPKRTFCHINSGECKSNTNGSAGSFKAGRGGNIWRFKSSEMLHRENCPRLDWTHGEGTVNRWNVGDCSPVDTVEHPQKIGIFINTILKITNFAYTSCQWHNQENSKLINQYIMDSKLCYVSLVFSDSQFKFYSTPQFGKHI